MGSGYEVNFIYGKKLDSVFGFKRQWNLASAPFPTAERTVVTTTC
jgi:hypothetical protein